MVYTMKKYLKELKTNPYWEVEPHFFYQSLWQIFEHFQTVIDNNMTSDDLQSALYGEFVINGKPIPKGFIKSFNSMMKFLYKLIRDSQFKPNRNNMEVAKQG